VRHRIKLGLAGVDLLRPYAPGTLRTKPVLPHTILPETFAAVRQVYAVRPEMGKTGDIELDT